MPELNKYFKIEKIKKEDRLRISRIGTMKIEMHRPAEGAIKKEARQYYAVFITIMEKSIPEVKDTNASINILNEDYISNPAIRKTSNCTILNIANMPAIYRVSISSIIKSTFPCFYQAIR